MCHESIGAEPRLTLTVAEAADLLGIGLRQAYTGVRAGEIPSVRIGHRILVPRSQLNRLLDESRPA